LPQTALFMLTVVLEDLRSGRTPHRTGRPTAVASGQAVSRYLRRDVDFVLAKVDLELQWNGDADSADAAAPPMDELAVASRATKD